jgi:hypothetical protein
VAESSTFKSRWRRRLARPPLRYLAQPVFEGVVAAELALARSRGLPDPASTDRLTAVVKTFERPRQLARLIQSLQRSFPGMAIIVADDSRVPTTLPGIRTLALPYDSGVSAGRQGALDAVTTELTWVLDDDFIVHRGTNLALVLALISRHTELDLIGGAVIDLPFYTRRGSPVDALYPTAARPLTPLGTRFGAAVVCDKVPNFFVARTAKLRRVGWDARLKRVEHGDFFTRARGLLTTAFLPEFSCLHAQSPFDLAYMEKRDDHRGDEALLRARYFPDAPR